MAARWTVAKKGEVGAAAVRRSWLGRPECWRGRSTHRKRNAWKGWWWIADRQASRLVKRLCALWRSSPLASASGSALALASTHPVHQPCLSLSNNRRQPILHRHADDGAHVNPTPPSLPSLTHTPPRLPLGFWLAPHPPPPPPSPPAPPLAASGGRPPSHGRQTLPRPERAPLRARGECSPPCASALPLAAC